MIMLSHSENNLNWVKVHTLSSQLNIKEAFRLSRYDWMCNALEAFLRVMEEDRKLGEKQDQKIELEPPSIIVADVPECQSMSPKCYKRSSTMQHHGMPPTATLLSRATQEIAIHFGYWHYHDTLVKCLRIGSTLCGKSFKLWSYDLDAHAIIDLIVCDHDVKVWWWKSQVYMDLTVVWFTPLKLKACKIASFLKTIVSQRAKTMLLLTTFTL